MEIRASTGGGVKGSQKKLFRFSRQGKPDSRAIILFIRIKGYLDGVWSRGLGRNHYYFWDKHAFSRRTGSGETGYSVKHLERMFPRFMAWCTAYHFERERLGRSWRIKVTRNYGVSGRTSGQEIRARLEGAICAVVKKAGVARVDREFLRKFCVVSHLPREAVALVWAQLRPLVGYACRWKGAGSARKFLVTRISQIFQSSHPQTSPGISSPTGRRDQKQSAAKPAGHDPDRPLAPLAQNGFEEESSAGLRPAHLDPPAQATASPPSATGPGAGVQATNRYDGLKKRQFCVATAVPKPMQICNRFVSSRRLLAKAVWLAVVPMKNFHGDCARVVWRFAHARNFAFRALRMGFGATAISAAYGVGVRDSHEDALDADRLPGGGYLSQREPSAAVVYGWRELQRDTRPDVERWAEFFALPYEPRRPAEYHSVERHSVDSPPAPRAPTPASTARRLADLRSVKIGAADSAEQTWRASVATVEAALKARGFTTAAYMSLPRDRRDEIMREILAAKKSVDTK